MSDKEREEKALKTITVSSRAAQRTAASQQSRERVKERTDELLVDLEDHVRADGNDPDMLAEIEAERDQLRD